MRRKSLYLIGCVCFSCWIIVLCYLYAHQPIGRVFENLKPRKSVNIELEVMEQSIKERMRDNEQLLLTLRKLSDRLRETGMGIDQLIRQNPDLIEETKGQAIRDLSDRQHFVTPVLVFACNRITVRRNIDQLLKYRPQNLSHSFPIVVSQDCGHQPTKKAIESYGDQVILIQQPDQSDFPLVGKEKKFKGYYKIARHYKWALNQMFHVFNYDTVIIVEDDLDISPDFFEYFSALHPILKGDPSLWCVSAWNDNGKEALVANDPEGLYRSDFFPGLGWMLTKDLWNELEAKWPKAFWDDWIRQPDQRKDRACIRPEISRTKTFGKIGVSNGLFYEKHLKFIKLNDKFVPFTQRNLTFLLKENYDINFLSVVYNSPVTTIADLVSGTTSASPTVRLTYRSKDQFKKSAKSLGLMDDFKEFREQDTGVLFPLSIGKDVSFWLLRQTGKDMTRRGRDIHHKFIATHCHTQELRDYRKQRRDILFDAHI